jgi:hypothetical protein
MWQPVFGGIEDYSYVSSMTSRTALPFTYTERRRLSSRICSKRHHAAELPHASISLAATSSAGPFTLIPSRRFGGVCAPRLKSLSRGSRSGPKLIHDVDIARSTVGVVLRA